MSVRVTCPSCGKRLHIPEHLTGRRTMCPGCNDFFAVPRSEPSPLEQRKGSHAVPAPAPADAPEEAALPWHGRLGLLSALLGLLAVPGLCLPIVGYAAPALSGLGLLAGLTALTGAWLDGPLPAAAAAPGTAGAPRGFGSRPMDFPLAGVAACLVGLILTLVPVLGL
jgi:hypothetical protein